MSAPDLSAAATPEAPAWTWTEEDANALFESAFWFHSNISEELIGPYRGMHIAIFGERIVDADSDFEALGRRLETNHDAVPMNRIVVRYIPPADRPIGRW
jgi:hypothetical protein